MFGLGFRRAEDCFGLVSSIKMASFWSQSRLSLFSVLIIFAYVIVFILATFIHGIVLISSSTTSHKFLQRRSPTPHTSSYYSTVTGYITGGSISNEGATSGTVSSGLGSTSTLLQSNATAIRPSHQLTLPNSAPSMINSVTNLSHLSSIPSISMSTPTSASNNTSLLIHSLHADPDLNASQIMTVTAINGTSIFNLFNDGDVIILRTNGNAFFRCQGCGKRIKNQIMNYNANSITDLIALDGQGMVASS